MSAFRRIAATLAAMVITVALLEKTEAQTDLTVKSGAKGRDVVDAVVRRIQRSGIFSEDSGFLRRWAYVQTEFGLDPNTYRQGYYGGIWQIDEAAFDKTKDTQTNTQLVPMHNSILQKFNIKWSTVTWQHLLKPLYSGLAARLFLSVLPAAIPGTLQEQGKFWQDYCKGGGQGTAATFVDAVKTLEKDSDCQGRMDICIVLDSSGSIQRSDYDKAKEFVADFIDTFSLDNVRVGFIVFSSGVFPIFPVTNNLTKAEMLANVRQATYHAGGTHTDQAILKAVELLTQADQKEGAPRVMTVFTDGQSNNDVTFAVQEAWRKEIQSFSVGIGTGAGKTELLEIAYNDPSHVFSVTSFDALADFFYRLNYETCTVPQRPAVNRPVTDQLKRDERRYYAYDMPPEGLTVKLDNTMGKTQGYYSYTEKTPSSAVNDGQIDREAYIPPRNVPRRHRRSANDTMTDGEQVYIAVEGLQDNNNYTIAGLKGDVRSGSVTSLPVALWVIASTVTSLFLASL